MIPDAGAQVLKKAMQSWKPRQGSWIDFVNQCQTEPLLTDEIDARLAKFFRVDAEAARAKCQFTHTKRLQNEYAIQFQKQSISEAWLAQYNDRHKDTW